MMERRKNGMLERWNVGMSSVVLLILTFQLSIIPTVLSAQKRAITFDDYIALKAVSDPQLSPDGKWVAYTVSTPSLQDNRNVSRVWVVEVATGKARQLTGGPGSDRQPRWSPDGKTLAFISTREGGAQVWLLPVAGGDARKVSRAHRGPGIGSAAALVAGWEDARLHLDARGRRAGLVAAGRRR